MSVNTVSVGRYRLPTLSIIIALMAAIALAVLAVADTTTTGSTPQVSTPAADTVPTPHLLQRYLDFEAPGSDTAAPS